MRLQPLGRSSKPGQSGCFREWSSVDKGRVGVRPEDVRDPTEVLLHLSEPSL